MASWCRRVRLGCGGKWMTTNLVGLLQSFCCWWASAPVSWLESQWCFHLFFFPQKIRLIHSSGVALVWLTAPSSKRNFSFFAFSLFRSQRNSSSRSNSRASGRFWQRLGLPTRWASFPPVSCLSRDNIIFHSHSLLVCVGACGALIFVVKRQIPLWQAWWRHNLLITFFWRADHTLWSVSVGSFTPLTMTCMYLRAVSGQKLLWVRGLCPVREAPLLCCSCFQSSQSLRGMLRQVPERLSQTRDERRISAAGRNGLPSLHDLLICCFYRERSLAFWVPFFFRSNRADQY